MGVLLTVLNLRFSKINVYSVSTECLLVCRIIWYFHQEELLLHGYLLQTVSIVLIIHCQECLVIRSVKHCYPRAVPTGSLTLSPELQCRGWFSWYCLNTGIQVSQTDSALTMPSSWPFLPSLRPSNLTDWIAQ